MQRDDLLIALAKEQRERIKSKNNREEVDFMLKNWQIFAESKSDIYAAIKGTINLKGSELCSLLGLGEVFVEKCKDCELLAFCYSSKGSKLYKKFITQVTLSKNCTIFFVAGKKAIVVSNKAQLTVDKDFNHRFPSLGSLSDIYWSPVANIAETMRVYNVSG